jgi:hypothetical protein
MNTSPPILPKPFFALTHRINHSAPTTRQHAAD